MRIINAIYYYVSLLFSFLSLALSPSSLTTCLNDPAQEYEGLRTVFTSRAALREIMVSMIQYMYYRRVEDMCTTDEIGMYLLLFSFFILALCFFKKS